jgi:hypothetical protein
LLQRERLGAIANKRGQSWPGNAVSWRFADPEGAVKVAILVRDATPDRFSVIAYNTSDTEQRATMGSWNVTAGTWQMTRGTGPDGGDAAQGPVESSEVQLERSAAIPVSFAPRTTTVMTFRLAQKAVTQPEQRPDLGIGADDVIRKGNRLALTVHSLGAVTTPRGTATLETPDGKILASAPIPSLAPPTDLLPKATTVHLTVPKGASGALRVRVATGGEEVTRLNDVVDLGAVR